MIIIITTYIPFTRMFHSKFFSFFFLFFFSFVYSFSSFHKCPPQHSLALLLFKQNLFSTNHSFDNNNYVDYMCQDWLGSRYHPIMMNWITGTDCCNWDGIICDDVTGDVIDIDLSCGMLQGTLLPNSTLFHLPHLQRLNLAFNDFMDSQIPPELGTFSHTLTHLNVSASGFTGQVPSEITLLSKLVSLDLSWNLNGLHLRPSVFKSLLQNSTYLRDLSMAYVNISWVLPTSVNVTSSLTSLDLTRTSLQGKLPVNIFSLPYLQKLDLSRNDQITGPLPKVNRSSNVPLKWLSLSYNNLSGEIPDSIGHLKSLNYLDLSGNKLLSGEIPDSIGYLIFLNHLDLSRCNLMGSLPKSLLNLTHLTTLYLYNNQFDGEINQGDIIKLISLTSLDLSFNNFTGLWDLDTLLSTLPSLVAIDLSHSGLSVVTSNVTGYVNQDFNGLGLASCKLTMFPKSLQAMKSLGYLDLSSNDIQGQMPDWAGEIGGNSLYSLNLSHNSITSLPVFQWDGLHELYLQYNQIEGHIPPSICNMTNLYYLDLSHNQIEGQFPPSICNMSNLLYLDLSHNQIGGQFPPSICNMSHLWYLDLSHNQIGGIIPQCFGSIFSTLEMVDMGNNQFHGTIPNVNKSCEHLTGFMLNGNQLEGDVPSFLSKCRNLNILDIGNNHLNGTFPSWLGDLPYLQVLVLKSNKLHGSIETFSTVKLPFPSLQVLDLSHNELVGHLPQKYFQNFNAMKGVVSEDSKPAYLNAGGRYYSVTIAVKGVELLFTQIMVHYTIVHLSNNKFEGEIPMVIGSLNSLKVLNLSHNNLNGKIPHALGNLSAIESLDLCWNQLTGEIPQSLADITTLEVLNLSHNHLVGRIPTGKQFDTFRESSFGGNSRLCGFQLHQPCEHLSSPKVEDDGDEDEEESGFTWKVVMLGFGCGTVIGFVMGHFMLAIGKPMWFIATADAIEHTFLNKKNKRRHICIS